MDTLPEPLRYVYDSIDHSSTEIRLFTLLPSAEKDARLCGRLHTAALEPSPPEYEALSYVWNDHNTASPATSATLATFLLHLDDGEVTISTSLALALFRIRYPCQPRVLWIDAVCIDQQNADEKSHQVQQMYRIYSLAYRVLIWLGNDGLDDSDTSIGRLLTSNRRYIKVAAVFFRTWWDRFWTLQEGLAASKASVVLCGYDEIPWLDVLDTMRYLSEAGNVTHASMPMIQIIQLFSKIYASQERSRRIRLDQLLHVSVRRTASNPLDVIYALYGLVRPETDHLKPDYSASVEGLFKQTMINIIEDRGDLNFLIHAARQKSYSPSWCVDFSSKEHRLDPTDILNERSSCRYSTNMAGASSGRLMAGITYYPECSGLGLSGTVVGTVTSTMRCTTRNNHENSSLRTDRATDAIGLLNDMHVLADFTREAWTRYLDTDTIDLKIEHGDVWKLAANGRQIGEFTGATSNSISAYSTIAQLEIQCRRQSRSIWLQLMGGWRPPKEDLKILRHVRNRLISFDVDDLSVFATDTGYVGSCYTNIKVDDVVCILFGCRLPLILRAAGNESHTLVDAVYVDGIMGGSFLWDKLGCTEAKFIIV